MIHLFHDFNDFDFFLYFNSDIFYNLNFFITHRDFDSALYGFYFWNFFQNWHFSVYCFDEMLWYILNILDGNNYFNVSVNN